MVSVRQDERSRLETNAPYEHMRPMVRRHGRPDDFPLQRNTATTEHAGERGHGSQAFERLFHLCIAGLPRFERDDHRFSASF
jgi:hypothetical protein